MLSAFALSITFCTYNHASTIATMNNEHNQPVMLLTAKNYHAWKIQATAILYAKGIGNTIRNATEVKEESKPTEIDQQKAYGHLVQMISPDLYHLIGDETNPRKIWELLESHFGKERFDRHYIMMRFWDCKFPDDGKITTHIANVRALADQLKATGKILDDGEKICALTKNLPSNFEVAKKVLLSDKKATFEDAMTRLLYEEEGTVLSNSQSSTVMFTSHHTKPTNHVSPNYVCKICTGRAHLPSQCPSRDNPKYRNYKNQSKQMDNSDNNQQEFRQFNRNNTRNGNQQNNNNRGQQRKNFNSKNFASYTQYEDDADSDPFSIGCVFQSNVSFHSLSKDPSLQKTTFIVDSGTTNHVVTSKETFVDFTPHRKLITFADKQSLYCEGNGTAVMTTSAGKKIYLPHTLYCPTFVVNLLSVARFEDLGFESTFKNGQCIIAGPNEECIIARRTGNLYILDQQHLPSPAMTLLTTTVNADIWHQRLAHLHSSQIHRLQLPTTTTSPCRICSLAKQPRQPIPKQRQHLTNQVLQLIHTDVCGPLKADLLGNRYFLTFLDDFSRWSRVVPMKDRTQVSTEFEKLALQAMNHHKTKIQAIRCDNGTEFTSTTFKTFCHTNGITIEYTTPYTKQSNGAAERLNRTIVEKARALLLNAQLPTTFWSWACTTASYLRNRSPSASVNHQIPFELWHNEKVSLDHLKVFGCLAFVQIPKEKRINKFASVAVEQIFVGYGNHRSHYICYNPSTKQFQTVRDVVFDETVAAGGQFFKSPQSNDFNDSSATTTLTKTLISDDLTSPPLPSITTATAPSSSSSTESTAAPIVSTPARSSSSLPTVSIPLTPNTTTQQPPTQIPKPLPQSRYGRIQQPKIRDDAFHYNYCSDVTLSHSSVQDTPTFINALSDCSFKEATTGNESNHWKAAMEAEINALNKNQTWSLIPRPANVQPLRLLWIFKKKYNAAGNLERFKARLVAQGSKQTAGIDYNETFSPVVSLPALRLLLAIAAYLDWEITHLDVDNAFLHGELQEEVHVFQPAGFVNPQLPHHIYRLLKPLYGLKQAPRCWWKHMHSLLQSLGFHQCRSQPGIYILLQANSQLILTLYVDDILLLSKCGNLLTQVKQLIQSHLPIKDLGPASFILNLQITRDRPNRIISISQATHIRNLLQQHQMENCLPASTPLNPGTTFEDESSQLLPDITPFQSLIGALLYIANATRPDITFATNRLSQFTSKCTELHLTSAKHILRYLKKTAQTSLRLSPTSLAITAFADADYAGCTTTRKSTSGGLLLIGGSPIAWLSRKQDCVAQSTAESEYIALAHMCKEVVWANQLNQELNLPMTLPSTIFSDNQAAKAIAEDPQHQKRAKHIDVKYHLLKDHVEKGDVTIQFVSTQNQLADLMTKLLPATRHQLLTDSILTSG